MRLWFSVLVLAVSVTVAFDAFCDDDAGLLRVVGRGVEGRKPYNGGGVVRFKDVSLAAQVIHYDGQQQMKLPLAVDYEVIESAPILLTSRLGTEYWKLCQYADETIAAVYSDEKIDLSQVGDHQAVATTGRIGARYGSPPKHGLASILGHYLLLIDPLEGSGYLDVVEPPPFFELVETARKLTCTLADLSSYSLAIGEIQSTWQPDALFRVKVLVRDAQGHVLPVVNAPAWLVAGDQRVQLTAQWNGSNEPTGWLAGHLPGATADRVEIRAEVTLETPLQRRTETVTKQFAWGEGRVSPAELAVAVQGYQLPRDSSGVVRETRALWASTSDIATADSIEQLIQNCRRARLNIIVPDIFVRNQFLARSDLIPWAGAETGEFDPLRYLIARAHEAGLEVHPWFCVSYRDPAFCKAFAEHYGNDVRIIRADGDIEPLAADVHRPEYRQFVTQLMIGVARDYDVDGIHLDYIRSKGRCYCEACRDEFQAEFGKPLTEADDADWTRWQRTAIGDIVQTTSAGVRHVAPGAKVSVAVFSNLAGGALQGQDPAEWSRRSWTDLTIPMDYKMQTIEVRLAERRFLAALDDDSQLVSGLSLYMRSGNRVMSRPASLVRAQIEEIRRLGIHGYCLFVHQQLSPEQIEVLRDEVNTEVAKPYFR